MPLETITFSIIMPCYNSEDYVENALNSVLNQTYSNWELIVVNDGSTDRTLDIVSSYAKTDKRIKIFNKNNGGYVSAVNLGLTQINSDYFLMLGSDDCLDVGLFEALYNATLTCDILPDVIAFRALKIYANGHNTLDGFTIFDSLIYKRDTTLKEFSTTHPEHSSIFFVRDTAKCFKTKILKELNYFGKTGCDADGIFSMLFMHSCSSFLCVPYNGYLWTIRDGSVSSSMSLEKNLDRIENWKCFYETLKVKTTIENITVQELQYIGVYSHLLFDIIKKFKYSVKYKREIKEHAKFIKKLTKEYSCSQYRGRYIFLISVSPPIASILYNLHPLIIIRKLRRLLKK